MAHKTLDPAPDFVLHKLFPVVIAVTMGFLVVAAATIAIGNARGRAAGEPQPAT